MGGDIASILLVLCAYAVFVGIWGALYLLLKQLSPLIRRFNRAKYYPLENEKRRYLRARAKEIALEKAKAALKAYGVSHGQMIRKRRSLNPVPTAEQVEAQWRVTRENRSPIEKVRLGAMLAALEGTVDNALLRDDFGNIIGRNPGLRGWLKEHCPHLAPHYKTLMRYKGLADKMQEVYGLDDPLPATLLLPEGYTTENGEGGRKLQDSKNDVNFCKYNGIYIIENSGGKFYVGMLEVTDKAAQKIQERRKEALEVLAGPCGGTMQNLEEALYRALGGVHLKRAATSGSHRPHRKLFAFPGKVFTVRMTAEDHRKYSPSYSPRKPAYRSAYRPFDYRKMRPASSYQMRSARRYRLATF